MGKQLSATQLSGLHLALKGTLLRYPGGYWSYRRCPGYGDFFSAQPLGFVPYEHVGVQTIRSLERCGLLEREEGQPEWKAPRTITEAGKQALIESTNPGDSDNG